MLCFALLLLGQASQPSTAERMIEASNTIREQRGSGPCERSAALEMAAQNYADYLARTNQFDHFANGKPWQRASQHGFTGTMLFNEHLGKWYYTGQSWKREVEHDVGEILHSGSRSIGGAFESWLKSPGHKAALLERSFNVCGFGYAVNRVTGRPIYVGMYGRE